MVRRPAPNTGGSAGLDVERPLGERPQAKVRAATVSPSPLSAPLGQDAALPEAERHIGRSRTSRIAPAIAGVVEVAGSSVAMDATPSPPKVTTRVAAVPPGSEARAARTGRVTAERRTKTAVERIMAVRPRTGSGLYRSLNKFPSRGARSVPPDKSGTYRMIAVP